jgi:hypothetical protein
MDINRKGSHFIPKTLFQTTTIEIDDGSSTGWLENNLDFYLQGSTGEIDHDYDFTIICNTKRLLVTVSPGLFQVTKQQHFSPNAATCRLEIT